MNKVEAETDLAVYGLDYEKETTDNPDIKTGMM